MTGGQTLADIVLNLATMVHSTLNGWVGVEDSTNAGGQLAFSMLPAGVDFAERLAEMTDVSLLVLNGIAHVPALGADLANVLAVLLQLE